MTKKKKTRLKAVKTLSRDEMVKVLISQSSKPGDALYAGLKAYSELTEGTPISDSGDGPEATADGDKAFTKILEGYEFWTPQGLLGMTRAAIRFMDAYVLDKTSK